VCNLYSITKNQEAIRWCAIVAAFMLAVTGAAAADDLTGQVSIVDGDTLEIHGTRIRLVWGFLCQGGVTPIWLSFAFHSFVRSAPRAFFRPDRIFPSPSRRSGGQGRRFFSAAEGLSLTDASTTAGCRRSGGWPRDDPRGACHWPRSIARTTLVFG
jgi:hypothetical protein